jgi:hypothetical protein
VLAIAVIALPVVMLYPKPASAGMGVTPPAVLLAGDRVNIGYWSSIPSDIYTRVQAAGGVVA